jgi:hypothetical protein
MYADAGGAWSGAVEAEREFGADTDGLAGFVAEVIGHGTVTDDGKAPVIQAD